MLRWVGRRFVEMQRVRHEEKGFTLIELLVVVIIIGILAAIAIPTFLAQRDRANEAALESDLRNAAAAATSCSAANDGSYATCDVTALKANGFNPTENVNITDAMITKTAQAFTIAGATHTNLTGVTGSFSTTGADAGRVVITP